MSSKQDDRREAEGLLKKVTSAFQEWDKNHSIKPNPKERLKAIVGNALLLIHPDQNSPELQEKREKYDAILNPDIVDISISPIESMIIAQGLNYLIQSFEAEKYIKESIGTNVTSEQRWSRVAEIMLVKEPGEKLSLHGQDEFIWYWALIRAGLTPKKASEGVFKKYKFSSQEACDKWLRREITKRQNESSHNIYQNIPKPSTSPRYE